MIDVKSVFTFSLLSSGQLLNLDEKIDSGSSSFLINTQKNCIEFQY